MSVNFVLQGKGEILTYWLTAENKQKRLRRLESMYSDSVSQAAPNASNAANDDIADDAVTVPASIDSTDESNNLDSSVQESYDYSRLMHALAADPPEYNSLTEVDVVCNGTGAPNNHRNCDIESRVEMTPLLEQAA